MLGPFDAYTNGWLLACPTILTLGENNVWEKSIQERMLDAKNFSLHSVEIHPVVVGQGRLYFRLDPFSRATMLQVVLTCPD